MRMVQKLKELDFNIYKTLKVIEDDEDLKSIFKEDIKTDFDMLYRLIKDELLPDTILDYAKDIFDNIIITKQDLIDKYQSLEIGDAPKKYSKKKVPRRYGKAQILKDIADGKPSELQRAMLSINKLKNIYVNLNARCIKDTMGMTTLLSNTDCRDIVATVTTVEKRLEDILKRKK